MIYIVAGQIKAKCHKQTLRIHTLYFNQQGSCRNVDDLGVAVLKCSRCYILLSALSN